MGGLANTHASARETSIRQGMQWLLKLASLRLGASEPPSHSSECTPR